MMTATAMAAGMRDNPSERRRSGSRACRVMHDILPERPDACGEWLLAEVWQAVLGQPEVQGDLCGSLIVPHDRLHEHEDARENLQGRSDLDPRADPASVGHLDSRSRGSWSSDRDRAGA